MCGLLGLGLSSIVGCQPRPLDDPFDSASGGESTSPGDEGESSGGGESVFDDEEETGESGDPEGGIKLDVGSNSGGVGDDGGSQEGCEKVDFLFVIDNSASMIGEQQSLAASFPGFVDALKQTLQADDYHVMVTATDATTTDGCEEMLCSGGLPVFPPPCPGYTCGSTIAGCDSMLGAGRVLDAGYNACPGIDADQRYLTDEHPDLYETFSCVAQLGGGGHDVEQQMGAMLGALSPELNGAGGCNDGFLRDDAILVVVIITDEEAPALHGGPADWHAGLVDAKNGNEDAIVMLTLSGARDEEGAMADDCWDPLFSPKIHDFTEMFGDYGLNGSVCAADYAPFFEQAVELIDSSCDEYVPEG